MWKASCVIGHGHSSMPLIFFCLQETVSWKPFGSRISLHFIFELKFPAALQVEMLSTVYPQTSQHRFASCSTSKLNTRVDFIIISHCWPAGYRGWKLLSLKTNCIFHRLLWGVLKQSEHHNADSPIEDLCQCMCLYSINDIEEECSPYPVCSGPFLMKEWRFYSVCDFLFRNL